MTLFNIGETIIDTSIDKVVTVIAIIPSSGNSLVDLYVLKPYDGPYYITDEENLIVYDKYYFDALSN